MAQRVLEPGQIESLAQRSIPRVRIPDYRTVFTRRAARLRELAPASPISAYLDLLARLADGQAEAVNHVAASLPDEAHLRLSSEHGMPPLDAANGARHLGWEETLQRLSTGLAAQEDLPSSVRELLARLGSSDSDWREGQAALLLQPTGDAKLDIGAAPFVAAALQVHFVRIASLFQVEQVQLLDAHGVCPLCGSLPVTSVVYARGPAQGYRYLHCSLCATEWHMVRVQCTACGAAGKDICYHTLDGALPTNDELQRRRLPAVRAETCDHCRRYRKILYEEQDTGVEAVADDLATLTLDLLLGDEGYRRASDNPLLRTPASTSD